MDTENQKTLAANNVDGSIRKGSPIRWYGSKGSYAPWIRKYLPRHERWVDVFGGGASVTISKNPSAIEVFNDLDLDLMNLWQAIKDRPLELIAMLKGWGTPSEEMFFQCVDWFSKGLPSERYGNLEAAARYFIVLRCSFSGESIVTTDHVHTSYGLLGAYKTQKLKTYWSKVEAILGYSLRFQNVQLSNLSYEDLVPLYDDTDTLLYCDPPYNGIMRTNRGQRAYAHEMTSELSHEKLLKTLLASKSMVVLSGYDFNYVTGVANDLYNDLLSDWYVTRKYTHARAGKWNKSTKRNDYREEVLWLNPLARERLADRGSDFIAEKHPSFLGMKAFEFQGMPTDIMQEMISV